MATTQKTIDLIIEQSDALYEALENQFRDETIVIDYSSQLTYIGFDKNSKIYMAGFDCFVTEETSFPECFDDEEYHLTFGIVDFKIVNNKIVVDSCKTGDCGLFYKNCYKHLKDEYSKLVDLKQL